MLILEDLDATCMSAPLGENGWKMRGVGMLQLHALVKRHGFENFRAFVTTLQDDTLRAFWSQRFQPLQWYDIWGLILALQALAKSRRVPFNDMLIEYGKTGGAFDITQGAHKLMSRVFGPSAVAKQFPRMADYMWQMYERSTADNATPKSIHIEVFNAPIMPGVAGVPIALGFLFAILEMFGAKNPTVGEPLMRANSKTRHGSDLMDISFDLTWG